VTLGFADMFKDLFEFFESAFLNWSAAQIAALLIGVVLGAVGLAFLARFLGFLLHPKSVRELERERDQLQRENQRLRERVQEENGKHSTILSLFNQAEQDKERSRAESAERNQQMLQARAGLKERVLSLTGKYNQIVKAAKSVLRKYRQQTAQLDQINTQIQDIMKLDGQFWQRPPTAPPPTFRAREERPAPIIAVLNLKGGVGKTTLTANLGARLWQEGLRVLQVDLDHQATLTSLCLTESQERDASHGVGKLINNVLRASGPLDQAVWHNLVPLQASAKLRVASYLLPANKFLADVEEDAKARWLLNKSQRDTRFILREALHGPLVQEAVDVVLLDCPPRITTGCINALAAADFVLVPVLLDKPSTDAVPNLLRWLASLKQRDICPRLSLLGIVGNRTRFADKLTGREKTLWVSLQQLCQEAWKEPVYFFKRTIPGKAQFAEAAHKRTFAAFDPQLEPIFRALVKELLAKKVFHENRRLAVVSS
jgi:cellulose biosynthesis protein BcsQ